jgi:spermidine synthase
MESTVGVMIQKRPAPAVATEAGRQETLPLLRIVPLFLFGSGFCALIYQTTWLREFRLIFGGSTAASAAVLGVFMAGLGFGGIVLGQRSEQKARPLAFYARLELLIALSAAVSPLLILGARHLYIAVGGTAALGMTLGTIARLILAALILGVPTFLMGGTLPAAARAVVTPNDTTRRSLGILYGCNTIGAVVGALAGTFYLFENFGNRLTLWWAAALNVVIALSALCFAKATTAQPSEPEKEESFSSADPKFVFIAAALVGFAFFLMEIVWYRMLAPLLGGSTFSFGLILASALLGIGLGGVAYSSFNLKRTASLGFFALTCASEAFFIALPYAFGDRIAMSAMLLRPLGTLGFYGHVMAWSAICLLLIFPAAFISGLQFPLLIALLGKGQNRVGSHTGAAYAWNTVGALAGSFAGGFGFLPMFSAPGVWKLVVVLLAALAVVAAFFESSYRRRWLRLLMPLATAGVALAMLSATGPTAFWRHSQIGVGYLRQYQGSPNEMRDLVHKMRRQIMWEADGIESSVALANPDGAAFLVNGKSDGNAKIDAGTQIMCGLIGAALHPKPEKAMVIGLGTGSTAGWLAAVPCMQRVDVAELERAILRVAANCAAVNQNALANPKLHVTVGDGRELLLTTREKYDLIVSEPSNPYRAGVANLFTRDFYQSVQHRLEPGGIFLQWIQTYDIDDRTIEILYQTLGSVFPKIDTWQTQEGDLLLVASQQPLPFDAEALRQRLAQEPFKSALRVAWSGLGLEDFLAHHIGNTDVATALQQVESWPLNTDDRTVIEFAVARSLSAADGFRIGNLRASAHTTHRDRPDILRGQVDWSQVEEARISAGASLNPVERTESITNDQRTRATALVAYLRGDLTEALRLWRSQHAEPTTLLELRLVAECLASEGSPAAGNYIERLDSIVPSEADAIRSELYWKQKRTADAALYLEKFLRAVHEDPWANQDIIRRSLWRAEIIAQSDNSRTTAGRFYDILQTPLSIWNCESDRRLRLVILGVHLDGAQLGSHTTRALELFEPYVKWDLRFLELRRTCYQLTGNARLRQATHELDDFLENQALTADTSALAKLFERSSKQPGLSDTPRLSAR